MNPITNMKNVIKLSEQELYTNNKTSWHDQYKDSAWIFIGGLPYDLTEGDVICIFSQYGEVVNINLIRDKDTGKSKGFCFLCYEDQRSTVLAVDNLNGIKVMNRPIRVDHVSGYKVPKQHKNIDKETKKLYEEGCAPKPEPVKIPMVGPIKIKKDPDDFRETLVDQIDSEIKLPPRLPIHVVKKEKLDEEDVEVSTEKKKKKKHKKEKKKKKKKRMSDSESGSDREKVKKKKKKRSRESSSEDESEEDKKRNKK